MEQLDTFYKSDKWRLFRQNYIDSIAAKGEIICSQCHKVIINPKQIILHHKQHLTLDNVADVAISLNPNNIELVCLDCHNKEHKRFGYEEYHRKKIYVVYGSPSAGKTTFIKSVAKENDLVIDTDQLLKAIGFCDAHALIPTVAKVKRFLITEATNGDLPADCYIQIAHCRVPEIERLVEMTGADLIHIDTPETICRQRAEANNKSKFYIEALNKYWSDYKQYYNILPTADRTETMTNEFKN